MSSLQDEQYMYELNRAKAEKEYFDQIKEEGIPAIIAGSMLINVIKQPGVHTAEEMHEKINAADTKHKPSKLLCAKFLNHQRTTGNIAEAAPGKYVWYGWNI